MANRRGNNEGSIYKRSDGRWAGSITVEGLKRKTVYAPTYKEVQAKLQAVRKAKAEGLPMPQERQTVGQFLKTWLESVKANVRPLTYVSYEGIVRLHLKPDLGQVPLARLTPQQVESLLSRKLTEKGLSPRRVQYIRAVLRLALARATKWGLVARNVATLVDPPRVQRDEITPLDAAQARDLLAVAGQDRLGGVFILALATGLRQGEVLGLRWQNVDLDKGTLTVKSTLQRVEGTFVLAEPKTSKSQRTLPLPKAALAALKQQRAQQSEDRLRAGADWQDEWGLVFTTSVGTPLDARNVLRSFSRLLDDNKLPKVRFHDLRHSCASLLLSQGVSLRMIMEILGHSQIGLTANLYTHIAPAMHAEAAAHMDAALGAS